MTKKYYAVDGKEDGITEGDFLDAGIVNCSSCNNSRIFRVRKFSGGIKAQICLVSDMKPCELDRVFHSSGEADTRYFMNEEQMRLYQRRSNNYEEISDEEFIDAQTPYRLCADVNLDGKCERYVECKGLIARGLDFLHR